MVITVVIWIYAAVLSYSYGFLFWRVTYRLGLTNQKMPANFYLSILLGLTILTTFANFMSLFIRIGFFANIILLGGACAILIMGYKDLQGALRAYFSIAAHTHSFVWILGFFLFGVILVKTVGIPTNWDSGLYHAQAILWIETYPAVPGLGNLLSQLGFNSSWLMTSAIFSFSFLGSQSFHVMDGFIFLLVTSVFLGKVNRLLRGEIVASNLAALALTFLGRRLFTWEVSSPGTDLPAAMLLWVVLLLGLEELEKREMDILRMSSLFFLACFITTVKLSTLPILLLLVLMFLQRRIWKQKRFVFFLVSGCTLLYLPWLVRNVIITGYLIFPFPAIDLFHFDWKVPIREVVNSADWIRSWARFPQGDKDVILKMSLFEWLPTWFQEQQGIDRTLLLAAAGGILLHGIGLLTELISRKKTKEFLYTSIITLVSFTGGLFWLLQAPAFRFGYGFLGFLVVFPACLVIAKMVQNIPGKTTRWAIGLSVLALVAYQVPRLYSSSSIWAEYPLNPEPYPVPSYESIQARGFILQSPGNFQCWYVSLPCAPWFDGAIELRGEDLSDGFRIPDDE